MRYSASEKLEIIRLVEQSHLPVRRTLGQIGIPRSTFYRWYDQYQTGGPEALDDRSPRLDRVSSLISRYRFQATISVWLKHHNASGSWPQACQDAAMSTVSTRGTN